MYRYLEVYEATLTDYLLTLDKGVEEFYAEVRESQDDIMDPYLKTFVDCLLASADYESFYKVMVREGKKKATQMKKDSLKAEVKESLQDLQPTGETPSEGKSSGSSLSLENPDDKPIQRSGNDDFDADAKEGSPRSPVRDDKNADADYK